MNDKSQKTQKKKNYHHGDLRRSMLDAADKILTEKGLAALSLRACARAAGVSHAAPAHHFGDLKGLLTALSAESFAMLGDLTEEVRTTQTRSKLFGALGRIYVDFATRYPGRFRLMMRRDIVDYTDTDFSDAASHCFRSMSSIISQARGGGYVTLDEIASGGEYKPLAQDIVLTWSLIHGFAHLRIEGNFDAFAKHMGGEDFDDEVWEMIGKRIGALLESS